MSTLFAINLATYVDGVATVAASAAVGTSDGAQTSEPSPAGDGGSAAVAVVGDDAMMMTSLHRIAKLIRDCALDQNDAARAGTAPPPTPQFTEADAAAVVDAITSEERLRGFTVRLIDLCFTEITNQATNRAREAANAGAASPSRGRSRSFSPPGRRRGTLSPSRSPPHSPKVTNHSLGNMIMMGSPVMAALRNTLSPPPMLMYQDSMQPALHEAVAGNTESTRSGLFHATLATSHAAYEQDECGFATLNQYMMLEELGSGSQGRVFLAMDTANKAMRAIKEVSRPQACFSVRAKLESARHRLQLKREVAIMKKCRHKSIVALYEVIDDPNQDRLFIVMQYIDKGPISRVSDDFVWPTVEPVKLLDYARQLSAGLLYIHAKHIAHRDIKPDNLLMDNQGNAYLADFGVSSLVSAPEDDDEEHGDADTSQSTFSSSAPQSGANKNFGRRGYSMRQRALDTLLDLGSSGASTPQAADLTMATSEALIARGVAPAVQAHKGTVAFLAPELLLDDNKSTAGTKPDYFRADVWALGLSFYVMLYGRLPFDLEDPAQYLEDITTKDIEFPELPEENSGGDGFSGGNAFVAFADPNEALPDEENTSGAESLKASGNSTAPDTNSPRSNNNPNRSSKLVTFSTATDDSDPFGQSQNLTQSMRTQSIGAYAAKRWRKLLAAMLRRDPAERCTSSQLHGLVKHFHREVERKGDEDFGEQSNFLDAFSRSRRQSTAVVEEDNDTAFTQLQVGGGGRSGSAGASIGDIVGYASSSSGQHLSVVPPPSAGAEPSSRGGGTFRRRAAF